MNLVQPVHISHAVDANRQKEKNAEKHDKTNAFVERREPFKFEHRQSPILMHLLGEIGDLTGETRDAWRRRWRTVLRRVLQRISIRLRLRCLRIL